MSLYIRKANISAKPVKRVIIDLGRQPEKRPLVKLYGSIEGVKIRRLRKDIVEITIPKSEFVGSRRAIATTQKL